MFGNFTTSCMKGLKFVAFLAIFQLNDDEELFDGVLKKFWAKWIISKNLITVGVCIKHNKPSTLVIQVASFI